MVALPNTTKIIRQMPQGRRIITPGHSQAASLPGSVWMPNTAGPQRASSLAITQLSPEIKSFVDQNLSELHQGAKEHFLGFMPIVFSRLPDRGWGKGKAENSVRELISFDVDRRMASFVNIALRIFTEEQHGFSLVPPFLHQRIMRGVVRPLIQDGDGNINADRQREMRITVGDIFRNLQRKIYHENKSPQKAAQEVFDSFGLTGKELNFGRWYFRAFRIKGPIIGNLKKISKEIAVLTYAWEMSNILTNQGEAEARQYIRKLPEHVSGLKGELRKLLSEEIADLSARKQLLEKTLPNLDKRAKAAREAGRHAKAGKLEFKMRELLRKSYYGENQKFASRCRQGRSRPVFVKPTARTFAEIMTLLVSNAQLPYEYNENGFLTQEGPMLLRVAKVADDVFTDGANRIYQNYRELDEAGGEAILNYRDELLEQLKQELDLRIENGAPDLKNLADNGLYPLGPMLDGWTTVYLIFDTDNHTYEEFMHGLMYTDPDYAGMLKNPIDVLQRVENYKLIYRNAIIWLQKMRDSKLHGPLAASRNNRGVLPQQIADRDEINLGAATFTGYAGIASTFGAFWTVHADSVVNAQATDWRGRRMLEKVLGNDFHKNNKILVNKFAQSVGYKDFWDMSMAVERALRFGTYATAGFLGLHALGQFPTGIMADVSATVASAFPYFAVPWASGKALAAAFGRDYKLYQFVNVPRHYEFDASEDLLYTVFCMTRGISVSWDKGHFQQNDCTISWITDMAQKLRWQAQNARLLRSILSQALANRQVMDFNAVFDAVAPCVYNNFGTAAMFNRLGIWGFTFAGLAPMLILNDTLHGFAGQTLLNWIIELSVLNYALVESSIRVSNISEGTPNLGTTLNFGYERVFIPFNVHHVLRRLWSNESAGFNVTGAITIPAKTMPWGTELDTAPFYLRKNLSAMGINALAMAHVFGHTMRDGVIGQDPLSLLAGTLMIWLGLDTYYTGRGMFDLNDGINPEELSDEFANRTSKRVDGGLLEQVEQRPLLFDAYGAPVGGGEEA
jgi:hypothetical protein